MAKNNLKPQLVKYTYDELMTDALREKQDGLIKRGRTDVWDDVLNYLEISVLPMFDSESDKKNVEIVIFELKERRKAIGD
jgi:hypothetical protein